MPDTTDDLVRQCFDVALDLAPDRREAYLREEIGDEAVRVQVRGLLAPERQVDAFDPSSDRD